jgi:hypothetical protein
MLKRYRLGRAGLAGAASVAILAACLGGGGGEAPATRVFKGGHVVTMDDKRTVAQAVAVRGDRIIAVGSDADMAAHIDAKTEVIDLKGRTLLPGFIDAHIHPVLGATRLGQCSMDGEPLAAAQIVERLQACLAGDGGAAGQWFEAVNVNPAGLVMSRADLDQVSTTRPVWVSGIDGHTGWANSLALQTVGITADTPNPTGGVIVRDGQGQPTGSLLDEAQALVTHAIPELSLEQHKAKTREALALARSKGLTSLQDAWASDRVLDVYDALEKDGTLKMRVRANLKADVADNEAQYTRLKEQRARFADHKLVKADGVKIFSDGVIEYPTQTAAMLSPYLDGNGNPTSNYGGRYFEQDVLERYLTRLDKEGFRVNVHSIGNYTTRVVLDAFEKVRVANGNKAIAHQISHLEAVHPDDIPRFAPANVLANMQMLWAIADVYTLDALKPYIDAQTHRYLYPAGSLKAAGATLVGGSDWPVDSMPGDPMVNTPLRAIYMAVTRTNPLPGDHLGEQFYPEERVDRDTMIAAYTRNGAKALGLEKDIGSIEVGKYADFVIFDEDITAIDINRLMFDVEVAATVFGGDQVYERPAQLASASLRGAPAQATSLGSGSKKLWHVQRSHLFCGHDHPGD